MRGILAEVVQVGFWVFLLLGTLPYMMKLNTLGTVQYEDKFDPLTLTKTVNDYDNSLLILLIGIIGLVAILFFAIFLMTNLEAVVNVQEKVKKGGKAPTFREDLKSLINNRFHITLLTLPAIGVLLVNILPILFMICIAFTNYDEDHQPPTYLFTWVGLENFKTLFTNSQTVTFGYAFI